MRILIIPSLLAALSGCGVTNPMPSPELLIQQGYNHNKIIEWAVDGENNRIFCPASPGIFACMMAEMEEEK